MSRPGNQRRPNNYYHSQGPKNSSSKLLDWNSYGVFFTCEFERDGVREATNLLQKYLDEPTGSIDAAGDKPEESGEIDIADELRKACEESNRPRNTRRIRQLPIGVRNCLFFSVADIPREKITEFVDKIVDDCQADPQCRYLQRALPIEDVSPAELASLKPRIKTIVKRQFDEFASKPENEGKHPSFAVEYKKTFSKQIERQQALDLVCEVVQELDAESKVNLTEPDFTVLFHLVRNSVMLACIKKFNQRRKLGLKSQEESDGSPAKKMKQSEAADEENDE